MSSIWTARPAPLLARLGSLFAFLLACDLFGGSPSPAARAVEPTKVEDAPEPAAPVPDATRSVAALEQAIVAQGGAGQLPAGERAQPRAALDAAWRFQTAAPISGSAASTPEGAVYFTSVEGYVHALAADGSFRWSRGLAGVPIGGPVVDRAGQVYVATSARRIYAVKANGRLKWMHPTPARVATAPVLASTGHLYYAARDRHVHALASWGGPLWKRRVDRVVSVPPAILEEGVVVSSRPGRLSVFHGLSGASHVELPGELAQPVLSNREHWFVVAGGELMALDPSDRSVVWRRSARHAALSADGEWLLVESRRELLWLDPATGKERHRVVLPDDPSAAPACSSGGVAMVPMVSGELLVAAPGSLALTRVAVALAPLWRPTWNERTQVVVVTAGNGTVSGVDLAAWHANPARERDGERSPLGGESSLGDNAERADVEAKASGSAGGGA